MGQLIAQVNYKLAAISEGGGKSRIAKQHEAGKMTARERIAYLLDKDSQQFEMGAFAAYGMYSDNISADMLRKLTIHQ